MLVDINIPQLDGYEVTLRLRGEPSLHDTPIVAITANALDEDRARCRDAGMDDFISKPFQAGELVATLARHLSYAHRKRDNHRLSKHCYLVC